MNVRQQMAVWALVLSACARPATSDVVQPITVVDDVLTGAVDDAVTGDATTPDADVAVTPAAGGGLWVVDALGTPIGVLVGRGHPSLSTTGLDVLRDGVTVFSPQTGLFFGLQMSTGKVIAPKIGVSDTSCEEPIVAGYYTADPTVISGQGYAFVYNNTWYRIDAYKPVQQVTCGGTASEGPDPKCSAHSGSCRGFPVSLITPPLPPVFPAPMAFSWVSK